MQCDQFRVENLGCEDESFYHLSHLKLENTEVGSEERKGREREMRGGEREMRGAEGELRRGEGERKKRRGEEGEGERRGRERGGMGE